MTATVHVREADNLTYNITSRLPSRNQFRTCILKAQDHTALFPNGNVNKSVYFHPILSGGQAIWQQTLMFISYIMNVMFQAPAPKLKFWYRLLNLPSGN